MRRRILCVSLYCSHKKQIIPTKPEVFIIAPTQKQLDNLKKGEAYRFTKENASEMGRRGQAASVKAHKRNKDVYMIGIAAGLIFGIMADNFAFNFDGKLDKEEFFNALKAILPGHPRRRRRHRDRRPRRRCYRPRHRHPDLPECHGF